MSLHAFFARYIYWLLAQRLKGKHTAQTMKELPKFWRKNQDELYTTTH